MEILKKLREQKGLSQLALAKELNVNIKRYNNWETGYRFPKLDALKHIAQYYGITVDELTGGSGNTMPTVVPTKKEFTLNYLGMGKSETNATIEEIEASIKQDLEDIKHSFFQIGYKLKIVQECSLYVTEGFDNLVDYAEARFGFGKTTTYNMLSVYDLIRDFPNKGEIKEDFKPYTFAQLTAMTASHWAQDSLPCYIKPDDTVEDIKKFIRVWNKENSKGNSIKGNTLKEVLELAEENKPAEVKSYGAEEHTSFMKDLDKLISPKKGDDVVPGQREIDVDSSEVVGEESFSFNYDQPDVDVSEEVEETTPTTKEVSEVEEIARHQTWVATRLPTLSDSLCNRFSEKKERIFSTPARIKNAVIEFMNTFDYAITQTDVSGGIVNKYTFAEQLSNYIIKNFNVIFKTTSIDLLEDNKAQM